MRQCRFGVIWFHKHKHSKTLIVVNLVSHTHKEKVPYHNTTKKKVRCLPRFLVSHAKMSAYIKPKCHPKPKAPLFCHPLCQRIHVVLPNAVLPDRRIYT